MKAAQAELEKAFAGTESEKALRLSLESKLSEMKKMREGSLEMAAVLEGKDRWARAPVRLRHPFVCMIHDRAFQLALAKSPPASTGDTKHGLHPWVGKTPRRRKRQPAPVFLPGESQGRGSLVGGRIIVIMVSK